MNQKLYIIFGTGPDSVGLVEKITAPISSIKGNIIDLRQDVLHGLFTVFMVVDLTMATATVEELEARVAAMSEETGLDLAVDRYQPVARSAEKRELLLILLGRDRLRIIATVADALKNYNINIEFSEMIARQGIFLMELMLDIRHCVIPLENLRQVLRERMGALGIDTLFQSEDVFNKKKRVLLFDIPSSFIDTQTLDEILQLTGIPAAEFNATYDQDDTAATLGRAAGRLENLPLEVATNMARALEVTPGTAELIQTLKIMGYKIALMSCGFTCVSDIMRQKLGIDHCFGVHLVENHDAMTLTGELEESALESLDRESVIRWLAAAEGVGRDDITVISDDGTGIPPGLRLRFDMKMLLEYFNRHILSREALIGLLGSFGIPAPVPGVDER